MVIPDRDPLYEEAKALSTRKGFVSASILQRVFRITYLRADRLIGIMIDEGFCSKVTHNGTGIHELLTPSTPPRTNE